MIKFSTELTWTGLDCYVFPGIYQNCTLSTCCSAMSKFRLNKRKIKSHYLFFHIELRLLLSELNRSGSSCDGPVIAQFYLHIHCNFFYPNIMIISKRVHTILQPADQDKLSDYITLAEAPRRLLTVTIQSEASLPSSFHCTSNSFFLNK